MQRLTLDENTERWKQMAQRPLSRFERLKIARPIHYSERTRTWSRVLKPILAGFPYGYVEMDLTYDASAGRYPLGITIHSQSADDSDKFLASYPDAEHQLLVQRYGGDSEIAKFLLYYDVWGSLIDNLLLDKWQRTRAPVPLAEVLKPEANILVE